MINVGVIGCGYWGPNLIRNFVKNHNCHLRWICDINSDKLKKFGKSYVGSYLTQHFNDVLKDGATDAVAIATPLATHYEIAKRALSAGKHVFIEKPFVDSAKKAQELTDLAKRKKLTLMIGYTFVYHPAVQKIHEIIRSGEIGSVYYIHSTRVNFGIFRHNESVIWDLASHDSSIMFYWFKQAPQSILCSGKDCLKRGYTDTATLTVNFKHGPVVYVLVSWLSPIKMRNMILVGSKKMLFFNDERNAEKIKLYDKGADIKLNSFDEPHFTYKMGSVFSPSLDNSETLEIEISHFLECIAKNKAPVTDGAMGVKIVKAIEAAEKSMRQKNKIITL